MVVEIRSGSINCTGHSFRILLGRYTKKIRKHLERSTLILYAKKCTEVKHREMLLLQPQVSLGQHRRPQPM